MLHGLRDGEIGHPGLDHGHAICKVDLADAVELGHAEENAVGERQCAAGERGAGPARHHLDALGVAELEHAADLRRGLWQHHHHGQLTIGGEPVAFVSAHLLVAGDDPLPRHDGTQRRDDLAAAGKHSCIGRGHAKGHETRGSS